MNQSVEFFKAIEQVYKLPIPKEVMNRARRSLLDYLAVTCAGAKFQEDKLEKYFEFSEAEQGKYKAIGTGKILAL